MGTCVAESKLAGTLPHPDQGQNESAEMISPPAGGDRLPDAQIYRVFRKDNVAVAVKYIHAAGVKAAGGFPARVVIDDAIRPGGVGGQVMVVECILVVAVPPA